MFADFDGAKDEQNCGKYTPRMVVVDLDNSGVTEHLLTVTVPRLRKTVVTTLLGWWMYPRSV